MFNFFWGFMLYTGGEAGQGILIRPVLIVNKNKKSLSYWTGESGRQWTWGVAGSRTQQDCGSRGSRRVFLYVEAEQSLALPTLISTSREKPDKGEILQIAFVKLFQERLWLANLGHMLTPKLWSKIRNILIGQAGRATVWGFSPTGTQ